MTLEKSDNLVRFVVPSSSNSQPARVMSSGRRKLPPISTSSPRDTGTFRPRASVLRTSINAAAQLFTMVAASQSRRLQIRVSTIKSLSPRDPFSRSYSRLIGFVASSLIESHISSLNVARPKFVCTMVPVKLNTFL